MKMKIGKWMGAVLGWLFLTLAISIALAMMVYIKSEKEAQKPGDRFWEIAGPGPADGWSPTGDVGATARGSQY